MRRNADSLQRSAIALATSMLYNNNEWRDISIRAARNLKLILIKIHDFPQRLFGGGVILQKLFCGCALDSGGTNIKLASNDYRGLNPSECGTNILQSFMRDTNVRREI